MVRLWKLMTWVLSGWLVGLMLFSLSVPAAAYEPKQNYLPMSGTRVLQPREYLYSIAGEAAPLLDRIISCESGWRPDIKNKGSSATGYAQFINSTWLSTRKRMGEVPALSDRTDPYIHLETFVWLYEHDGLSHWSESRPCWKR